MEKPTVEETIQAGLSKLVAHELEMVRHDINQALQDCLDQILKRICEKIEARVRVQLIPDGNEFKIKLKNVPAGGF